MRGSLVVAGCLGLFLLGADAARGADGSPTAQGGGVVAYYFHYNARCQTCLLIEQRAAAVIGEAFAGELADGSLAWNVVNTQQPGNRRFAAELGLPPRGLFLVGYRDGRPERRKNLDGVWDRVHGDPAAFRQYVSQEVRDFLVPKP